MAARTIDHPVARNRLAANWINGVPVRSSATRRRPRRSGRSRTAAQGDSVLWHHDRRLRLVGMAVSRPTIYRSRRLGWPRRSGLLLGALVVVGIVVAVSLHGRSRRGVYELPSRASLAGLSLRQRVVAIARSQVGYRTDPSDSYCNKFSAFWHAGATTCPSGERAEEWCADFAAWAWRKAGIRFTYGYGPGEINASAVSFYQWAVFHGTWHPANNAFTAAPGDVAVYGLSLHPDPRAVHVAIVTHDAPGRHGPNVVNGDGDHAGFSVADTRTDQVRADGTRPDSTLAGYAAP